MRILLGFALTKPIKYSNVHIKPFPKLPPLYEAKLYDLDEDLIRITKKNELKRNEEGKKLKIKLKTNEKSAFISEHENLAPNKTEFYEKDKNGKEKKIFWRDKTDKSQKGLENHSYTSRNVDYMLHLWNEHAKQVKQAESIKENRKKDKRENYETTFEEMEQTEIRTLAKQYTNKESQSFISEGNINQAIDDLLDSSNSKTQAALTQVPISQMFSGSLSLATVSMIKQRIQKSMQGGTNATVTNVMKLMLTGTSKEDDEDLKLPNLKQKGKTDESERHRYFDKERLISKMIPNEGVETCLDKDENVESNDKSGEIVPQTAQIHFQESLDSIDNEEISEFDVKEKEFDVTIARYLSRVYKEGKNKSFSTMMKNVYTLSEYMKNKDVNMKNMEYEIDVIKSDLLNALVGDDLDRKYSAAQILFILGFDGEDVIKVFEESVTCENDDIKTNSALSLCRLGKITASSIPILIKFLSEKSETANEIILAFEEIEDNLKIDLLNALINEFDNPIDDMRIRCLDLFYRIVKSIDNSGRRIGSEIMERAQFKLMERIWRDGNENVKKKVAKALSVMKIGNFMIDNISYALQNGSPLEKIDALKLIASINIMTRRLLNSFLIAFDDHHSTVRMEACKTACALKCKNSLIINALVQKSDDCFTKTRAYALKALGNIGIKDEKVLNCIIWTLEHDNSPTVVEELKLPIAPLKDKSDDEKSIISSAISIKNEKSEMKFADSYCESIFYLLHSLAKNDSSNNVKATAEQVLRNLNCFIYDLEIVGNSELDSSIFTDEATVLTQVREMTTKKSITEYIMTL
ncbi:hypothetical protein O9G_001657 [Rozella allomycis CSF55]|uniref:Uncharacterized protein n=1 Tax=Rozella allomycis (strain CSF55) TaxID=988480 RepID=A0A075AXE9_ROZAC|nr:hypothetical protein O9G_001657 [Rozella allomycis CSF55]|eukprot:EPZ34927.1 hypothetical protein O9G_001657 [Rozella allomycis CSF55]